ncbi:CGNR zinc finger domain-containing protein [Herbidospora mongoliensis]|uniref:CGNR zinc finger domain-containing protein n=1 Tax=Herbidospora mongoliensis TaxID=688067 RepID=UPI0008326E12|nr:CGNR zinc finger domain-containing protein [Herbidospora mongoliensis]
MNFNSHTDAVVEMAVTLVNTLTPGERRGRPYAVPRKEELSAELGHDLTEDDVAELSGYAAELRVAFSGDLDRACTTINRLLAATDARPHLTGHDGEPWHLHFHGAGGTWGGNWTASCATSLAIVLGGEFHDRLGVCTADRCDRVFVDVSRNGTRRFCSTACQNRTKTAAFRART